MKKGLDLGVIDYYLFGVACLFIGFFLSSIFLEISPIRVLFVFVKYKWLFLFLSIIIGIKPWWTAMFGKKSAEGIIIVEKKKAKKRKTNKK